MTAIFLALSMCICNNAFGLKSVLFKINNAILPSICYTLVGMYFYLFSTFMNDFGLNISLKKTINAFPLMCHIIDELKLLHLM